jgi:hypothetical protein
MDSLFPLIAGIAVNAENAVIGLPISAITSGSGDHGD